MSCAQFSSDQEGQRVLSCSGILPGTVSMTVLPGFQVSSQCPHRPHQVTVLLMVEVDVDADGDDDGVPVNTVTCVLQDMGPMLCPLGSYNEPKSQQTLSSQPFWPPR